MIAVTRQVLDTSYRASARREVTPAQAPQESRALVVVHPVAATEDLPPRQPRRASASFLAQLIATDQKFPQTRARNRLSPHEAVAAYRAVESLFKHTG